MPRSTWDAPWDQRISSLHASLNWHDGKLTVRRLPGGRNPIFFGGTAQDEFTVVPGETFVIGETTFTHFADGTAHKNRMQGNDFVQSVMYTHGVKCSSCHDVHGTENNALLIKPASISSAAAADTTAKAKDVRSRSFR